MADEEAESIGGISVEIGASHARLPGDIATADQIFEEARARWEMPIILRAQAAAPSQTTQAPARPAPTQRPTPIRVGPGSATRAQVEQSQTSFQRAVNAELAKSGLMVDPVTGEPVPLTKTARAPRPPVATPQQQTEPPALAAVQQQAAAPTSLAIDTAPTQEALNGVLATLREIVAETQKIAALPASRAAGTTPAQAGPRRAATPRVSDAQPGTVYTADPAVYEEQDRIAEARSGRAREIALQSHVTRQEREEKVALRAPRDTLTNPHPESSNFLNANPPQQSYVGLKSDTNINDPDYRSNEDRERERGAGRPIVQSPVQQKIAADQARKTEAAAAAQRRRDVLADIAFNEQAANKQASAQSARVRRVEIDEQQQARQVESRRASITGSGRTSRTLASGLGALFGGTEQRQLEAQARAQQAARALRSAESVIAPLDQRLRQLREGLQSTDAATRQFYEGQIKSREGSREYQDALRGVTKATKDDAEAQAALAKISSGGSVARNLVAITTAGVAFGAGLKVVDTVLGALVPAMGNFIDIQTGFGATSTRVTSALGQQTLALHGNVDAALAAADAQANLSASASEHVDKQLRLTTQIKAGALAQQQSSELFRAAAGAGNAPTGLFGGFGGVGGTSFLAQQMGGGRGFTETLQQDIEGLRKGGGQDTLGLINNGLSYVGNQNVRDFTNQQASKQGNVPGNITAALSQIPGGLGDVISGLNPFGQNFGFGVKNSSGVPYGQQPQPGQAQAQAGPQLSNTGIAYLNDLNAAAGRGATALGSASRATVEFTTDANKIATAVSAAAQAGDVYGASLAEQDGIVVMLGNAVADTSQKYRDAIEQLAVGKSITPPEDFTKLATTTEKQREIESAASVPAIQMQQAFARPAQIAAVGRQTDYEVNTQLPAQVALSTFASPNAPVGTGIPKADQSSRKADMKEANDLQKQLNANAAIGQQIIQDTYRPAILTNFGTVALQQFDAALSAVKATGAEIASIQAGITNEQAAYQVAQYNFQLQIARRTLSDIGGLTGKNFGAGESYLGVLERQNLALSRQAQMLGFALSQRQINFQTALAGFQAPGVTPEERQARIEEAKTEAGFAQKQLDISKQIFGNQVQIVDISNLRQGADLAKQIALLVQGRKVTIDTAAAEQKLLRLQQLQQQNVAKVNAYMKAVDNLATSAFAEIQQLETAAGHALTSAGRQAILTVYGFYRNLTNMFKGTGAQTLVQMTQNSREHASGGVFETRGMSQITPRDTVGEAGGETVAILSHPRPLNSGGGGMTVSISFTGDIKANDAGDLEKVTAAVIKGLGRQASILGLRGVG